MDRLQNKISLVKSRLAELIARKESAPVRLELYWIARDVDELLGPPISDQLEHISPAHDYQAMHRIHPRTHRNLILVVDEDEAARQYLTAPLSKEFDIAEAGADDHIAKLCDIDILRTRILSLLKRRQRLRQEVVSMQEHTELVEFKSQLSNADFSIGDFCYELAMSRSSVYNKLKTLTGKGPNDIIKIVRLSKARDHAFRYGRCSHDTIRCPAHRSAWCWSPSD